MLCNYRRHFWKQETSYRSPRRHDIVTSLCKKTMKRRKKLKARASDVLLVRRAHGPITKTRAPDFLFLHEKDFWFKQIWVDLHQTMVLDREGSYTRPVLGLVRCVCKDETEQTGRTSPIKMRICNLHFFAPWKPTGLHIMDVSERDGLRVTKPKERGGRDEKLHGQNGMRCTGLYRTVSP